MASTAFMTEIAGAGLTSGSGEVTAVGADLATVPHHPGDIVVSEQGTWHVIETITGADTFTIAPQWPNATGTATLRVAKVSPLHTADGLPGNVQLLLDEVRKKIAVGGLISGAGDPADNIGQDGEYYLNMANPVFWGPKAGGTWDGSKGTPLFLYPALQGPPGEQGPPGVAGTDGADVTAILARVDSRAGELIENSLGTLGNNTNFSNDFGFDASNTPNVPGSFWVAGYYSSIKLLDRTVPVDPNRVYRLGAYVLQDSVTGDWSAYANGERHKQYIGLNCYDIDGGVIGASNHMRYRHNGIDSLTTLAAPLTPGDMSISLANAAGWNETSNQTYRLGVTIFEYKNSFGKTYDFFSRLYSFDLFDLGGVNKTTNVVTLKAAFPASLGNPDDPNGTWPAGTRIANCDSGSSFKYALLSGDVLAQTDRWYCCIDHIGGIDESGLNIGNNFPPGVASVRPLFLSNYSNRSGGYLIYPDTGPNHKVRYSGVSIEVEKSAKLVAQPDGRKTIYTVQGDPLTGNVSMSVPTKLIKEV